MNNIYIFRLYTYVKENNTKMSFPLVCYDVASGSESETDDCKDDIKPVVVPVSCIFSSEATL